ncbi:Fur family transcriptional regulator [Marinosulfonomonas sp. PRT-SC04]|nr:Fur family transcriptional regulator [Marinosulfonomonas sp. PRT-SC04]
MPNHVAFHDHDHSCCEGGVLDYADQRAREAGLRLTPVRRKTLEILLETHSAMGAYDVLERLSADGFGDQPPVAYRALDFLVTNGLAHKIRRLNAYTACMYPEADHAPVFMICRVCDAVAEAMAQDVRAAVRALADAAKFRVERMNVEVLGLCPSCQEAAL